MKFCRSVRFLGLHLNIGDACGGLRLRLLGIEVTIILSMGLAIGLLFLHSWQRSH
ncbi:hypothetical protein [Nostoc sp.]|uniref:hypothetical protein n=1 Tax=Nostoc sp. TaxID=1180 RepID=UPI002FF8CEE3